MLNCAIDKYVFVIVKQRFDDDIHVNYSKRETVSHVEDLEHELVREAMYMSACQVFASSRARPATARQR